MMKKKSFFCLTKVILFGIFVRILDGVFVSRDFQMKLMQHIQRSILIGVSFWFLAGAQDKTDSAKALTPKTINPPLKQQQSAKYYRAALSTLAKTAEVASKQANDTLKIEARLIEIPGKFAPNDLYNYVYIMKYRVVRVLKGSYAKKEILVGHYNPLIPRDRIKDKMAEIVHGTVKRFAVQDKQVLTLIRPIDRVWKDAVEDEYTDSDIESYFALEADTLTQ
jgi:hypothetical protein